MPVFNVQITITNKPSLRDPEGETILHDLVRRNENTDVTSVRTARLLKFAVEAPTAKDACDNISEMCTKLRIYNPLVSDVIVESD